MPIVEFMDLAIFSAEISALAGLSVEVVLGFVHLEPFPTGWIVLWEEES